MKPGDQVGGRWQLVSEAPGEADVVRFRAVDPGTGEPAEVLALRSPPRRDGPQERAFAEVHRRLSRTSEPGLVRTLHADVDANGRAFVVREPLEDPTLADVEGPLDPRLVAAIGARLAPAVLAAGGGTGGALTDLDVGIDASGRPVLAPRGRPSSRVAPTDLRWVAPESFAGGAPDGAAGLYGLGVLLYRLATGRDPGAGQAPTPSSVRRGLPPVLDRAILTLLASNPASRAGALPLLLEVAGELGDLRPIAKAGRKGRATMDPGEVLVTQTAAKRSSGRADVRPVADPIDRAKAAVSIPARALRRLDPDRRSAAAGWAGLPESAVEGLASKGLPLVLEPMRSRRDARKRAQQLAAESGLPIGLALPPGCAPLLVGLLSLTIVPVVALVAFLLNFPVVLAVLLSLVTILGVSLGWWVLAGRAWQAVRAGWAEARRVRAFELEELGTARERIASLRRRVARSDLPPAASHDLRQGLREVEEQLEALARIATLADEAIAQADVVRMRTRLATLAQATDPAAATERDRLARALADLDEVERRRERARADIAQVETSLDEVEAAIGRLGAHLLTEAAPIDAMDRLVRSTRLARESVEDLQRDAGAARARAQLEREP